MIETREAKSIIMIQDIPERFAYLILLYMHGALTPDQHDDLDKWLEESQENVEMFAAATDEDHIKVTMDKIVYGK